MPGAGQERLIQFALEEALEGQKEVPAELGGVIARLLATSPEQRYASANAVITVVNKITGSAYEMETRETAASYALRTHFVDREAEIEALQTLWEQAQAGEGKLVLIGGEGGVGKTRLMEELEVQAELEGAHVVWGQCVESGGSAYRPWREVLRVLVRYVEDADETVMGRVGPVLGALLPELWERDYMAGLMPPAELNPQAAQLRLNGGIAQVLRAAAGLRPTMIIIEDAQWADEATLELLRFLTRVSGQAGLMVCVTYRSDEIGPEHPLVSIAGERAQRIPMQPLSPKVTTEFVSSMLGLERLPALLADRVQQAAGGNAFFVQELIRSLAAEGQVLQRTVGGWQVDEAALREAQLPDSIRQVVERRLKQLSPHARQVLEWGALVGMVFWEEVVAEVGRVARAEVRTTLAELLAQDLVVVRDETTFAGEREYLFLNPTVREASYESISQGARQEIHSRVAAWLMARSDGEVDEHLGLIAEHLEKAGQTEQAVTYLRQAGEQAAARFANIEAAAYLSRALELTPQDAWEERYTLLLVREKVYDLLGARETQTHDLAILSELAEILDDDGQQAAERRIEMALRRANYATVVDAYPEAVAAAQEAIRLSQATKNTSQEMVGYFQMGRVLWQQAEYKAAQFHLEQALARAAQVPQVEANTLRELGIVSDHLGDYARAVAYLKQALPIYHRIGDQRGESVTLNGLGDVFIRQGNYGRARNYFEQTLHLCREIGYRPYEAVALSNLSLLSNTLGDSQAAREYSQRALVIAREIGARFTQGYSLTHLGHALVGLGLVMEAAKVYRQALDIRHKLGAQDSLVIESLAGLACATLAQGDLLQAQTQVEEILRYLESNTVDDTEEPFRIYLTCYRILRANQDPRAQAVLNMAYRLLQERVAKTNDEEIRRSFLEDVVVHREIVQEYEKSAQT